MGFVKDMSKLDLNTLVGGRHLTMPVRLVRQGIMVKFDALIDSGANGYAFLDSNTLRHLNRFSEAQTRKLPNPIPIQGYNGSVGKNYVSFVSYFDLHVDKRIQRKTPFLILPLGNHPLILGRKWLQHNDVWLNCRLHRLKWPDDTPPSHNLARYIEIPHHELFAEKTISRKSQRDADRRDRLMDRQILANR